jgi:L-ascorbate metabolism protein UlaG (beta-lactamase superfamily)
MVAALVLGVVGCTDGGDSRTAEATTTTSGTPSSTTTSAPALAAETVAARRAFFGDGNVDQGGHLKDDAVIASWFGIASVAVAFGDRVVLLDTAINNPGPCLSGGGDPAYVPVTEDDLVALDPVAIFVGHGHSDHACDLGRLLADTGASLVGLPQHCAGLGADVDCVEALPADSPLGATAPVTVPALGNDVRITAVRNLHSGRDGEPPCTAGGCEAVLYRFEVGDLSFVWNDTNGPISTAAPELVAALRKLPSSDVELGAIVGLGTTTQGMRDPVDYAAALRVTDLYPLHHDTARGGASAGFRSGLETALAERPGLDTTLHWLQDPADYLRPLVLG